MPQAMQADAMQSRLAQQFCHARTHAVRAVESSGRLAEHQIVILVAFPVQRPVPVLLDPVVAQNLQGVIVETDFARLLALGRFDAQARFGLL